jgi:hypothetical protein
MFAQHDRPHRIRVQVSADGRFRAGTRTPYG